MELNKIILNVNNFPQEKERSKDLLEAAKHCESMATELLALASSLEGAARLLTARDRRQMPLLDILVEQEQKEVISHPAVQRYLQVSFVNRSSSNFSKSCLCTN